MLHPKHRLGVAKRVVVEEHDGQLAVASPISGASLARAFLHSARASSRVHVDACDLVLRAFDARAVVLTDSGTSALVLALRAAVPSGGTVGFPAYGCVDLVAAALFAGVRIRLYDIDPATLSPDLDSVRRVVAVRSRDQPDDMRSECVGDWHW